MCWAAFCGKNGGQRRPSAAIYPPKATRNSRIDLYSETCLQGTLRRGDTLKQCPMFPMLRNLWWRDTSHIGTLSLGYRGVPWRQVLLYYQFWVGNIQSESKVLTGALCFRGEENALVFMISFDLEYLKNGHYSRTIYVFYIMWKYTVYNVMSLIFLSPCRGGGGGVKTFWHICSVVIKAPSVWGWYCLDVFLFDLYHIFQVLSPALRCLEFTYYYVHFFPKNI